MTEADDALPKWIVAICSVVFDVDIGQKVEHIHPADAITEEEQHDLAFHAFPDSLSMELHSVSQIKDSSFFFRCRRRGRLVCTAGSPGNAQPPAAGSASESSHYQGHQDTCLYGYVFCRQRQDERLRRGAEQKSVVVLSELPYSSVLRPLSQYVGPFYFNHGAAALEQVFTEVMQWPAPLYGTRTVLPVGVLSLLSTIPPPCTLPPPSHLDRLDADGLVPGIEQTPESALGVFHEVDVYTPLRGVLKQLWTLWELMLLAEPIMVVGPTPGDCSNAVAALVSLMAPLPYSADFRPYFTIHDVAFAPMSAGELPSHTNGLPRLIGVTNLYFVKALPKWSSVLSVAALPTRSPSNPNLAAAGGSEGAAGGRSAPLRPPLPRGLLGAGARARQGPQYLLTERVEMLWTPHKPHTRFNSKVVSYLLESNPQSGSNRVASVNSNLLRKHFSLLTRMFLDPFMSYLTPLTPDQLLQSPGIDAPGSGEASSLKPFSRTEFLESLKLAEFPELLRGAFSSTSQLIGLYRRFLESPNFSSWFERRRHAVWEWQQEMWRRLKLEQVQGSCIALIMAAWC